MTERMQERVDELLARAEDFRRHGEDGSADAALALAEKIMIKYSIDAAVIAARRAAGVKGDEIVQRVVEFTGIYRMVTAVGFHHMTKALGSVRSFTSKGPKIEHLYVIGFESDVAQAQTLVTSVHLQALAGMNNWWRTAPERQELSGMPAYKARRQYVASFIAGATARVATARRVAVADAETASPGTELVLRTQRDAVDAYVNEHFNLIRRGNNVKPGTATAAIAGFSDGQRANTGDTPVGTVRRQITSQEITMTEYKDADELLKMMLLPAPTDTTHWFWWAPGDATRYRVMLVRARAGDLEDDLKTRLDSTFAVLVVQLPGGGRRLSETLALAQPSGVEASYQPWTAERFLATVGHRYAGWWGAVRPLCAALGWTTWSDRSTRYRASDARRIERVMEKTLE